MDNGIGPLPRREQESQLETLDRKRARLRDEMRRAYSAWLLASEGTAHPRADPAATQAPGHAPNSRTKWANYLAAKQRLVAAYAERPPAA